MKSLFIIFIIVSFTGVALFGIFGMHTDMQSHGGDCIAAIVQGVDCPKESSIFEYLFFHLNEYKNLSLATLGDSLSTLIFILLTLCLGFGVLLGRSLFPQLNPSPLFIWRLELLDQSTRKKLLRWLALHENSPTTI